MYFVVSRIKSKFSLLSFTIVILYFFLISTQNISAAEKIAFSSGRDGNPEIYVMNPDGSNQTRLTNDPADDVEPWLSADGSKIAFWSRRDGNNEIYVMNDDGSDQTRLTNNTISDFRPEFSPDGNKIVFVSDRNGNPEIYIMNADGSNQIRLTNNPAADDDPSFSPDGSRIVFWSARSGNSEIYVMNVDGSNPINLTNNSAPDYHPSFSPDGSRIAFVSQINDNPEIYVMNADGSSQTRLTNNPALDFNPSFSPDGNRIAFFSHRDGNGEIYAMYADGSNQINLTNNPSGDSSPSWSTGTVGCPFVLSPTSGSFTRSGGNGIVNVTTGDGCTWSAASNVPWITITDGGSGNDDGTVNFSVAANTGAQRTGTLTIAGQIFTVTQAAVCTYSVSSPQSPVNHGGVTGTINVTTEQGCTWTAQSNVSWITITSGSNGTGNGTVQYTVAPNVGPTRFGTIAIAEQTFSIEQGRNCSYSSPNLNGAHFNIPANGGSFSFTISRLLVCNPLTMTVHGSVSLTGGSSVTADTTITETFIFSVPPNTSGLARTGAVEWFGLATQYPIPPQTVRFGVTFSQPTKCVLNLASTAQNYNASGGTDNLNIREVGNCGIQTPYTASSNVPWLTIPNPSGNAPANPLAFSIAANTGPARSGVITISSAEYTLTFTVNQASGCSYALSSANVNIPASGANGSFNINAGEGCAWNPTTNIGWINVTPGSGSGNGTINFSVQPNVGPARSGTITVGGQTFTINQANGCSFALSATSVNFGESGGNASINVTTGNGCTWTASSNVSWINVTSGANSTGNGSVGFSVAVNTGPPRTGTLTIAGQTVTVNQTFNCAYSLSSTSANISASGGTINFNINTGTGCDWTVVNFSTWLALTSPSSGVGNGTVSLSVEANNGAARSATLTVGKLVFTVNQAARTSVFSDFDGDGKADISVFRPDGGNWYLLNSQSGFAGVNFGIGTDKIVPADYDGDGKTDIAVFRDGNWYLLRSQLGFTGISFGLANDIPLPADYDGDGKADLAVSRLSNGLLYVLKSSSGLSGYNFGQTGDKPVMADYDGDGKADIAVFRNGVWRIQRSQLGFIAVSFGIATDKPVPADYDGDGKADLAVFRVETGIWYIQRSRDGFLGFAFGIGTDKPVPADYDGDGKTDIAVFRDGNWYMQRTTGGFLGVQFGTATDKPVPNAFIP